MNHFAERKQSGMAENSDGSRVILLYSDECLKASEYLQAVYNYNKQNTAFGVCLSAASANRPKSIFYPVLVAVDTPYNYF